MSCKAIALFGLHVSFARTYNVQRVAERLSHASNLNWVAVKELSLSYYLGETLVFATYTHDGDLIQVP